MVHESGVAEQNPNRTGPLVSETEEACKCWHCFPASYVVLTCSQVRSNSFSTHLSGVVYERDRCEEIPLIQSVDKESQTLDILPVIC